MTYLRRDSLTVTKYPGRADFDFNQPAIHHQAGDFNKRAHRFLGILFGAGVASSPFGGIPVVTTAFAYKRLVQVEGIVGHTWWGKSFQFQDQTLDTRRRQIGGHAIIYPFEDMPLGFVGGWLRTEEIAQRYYEYSKLSEGLVLGIRVSPLKNLAVTAAYNPSKHRIATEETSTSENDQFLIYLTGHVGIGGAR